MESNPKPLLAVDHLVVSFAVGGAAGHHRIVPVNDISLDIAAGEVVALVGESGSGKTTVGRTLLRILNPDSGVIRFDGEDVTRIRGKALVRYRASVQMIFQDPFGSLNPAHTVAHHLRLPLEKSGVRQGQEAAVDELLTVVGLTPVSQLRAKYPHELSGGQRQRVAIARALARKPRLLVADEPVSMLDVSIRAGVLQLMKRLQEEQGLGYLYITHDLASARYFANRIAVMYGGHIVERGHAREIVRHPVHPYTQLLMAATPGTGQWASLPQTSSRAPDLRAGRLGCPFAPRCPLVIDRCHEEMPALAPKDSEHQVACWVAGFSSGESGERSRVHPQTQRG